MMYWKDKKDKAAVIVAVGMPKKAIKDKKKKMK